jgi:hypothetical protein
VRPNSGGGQRLLWILLMAGGGFGMWAGGQIGDDGLTSNDGFTDTGDYVRDQLEAGGRDSTGGAIVVAGGIVFFLGFFGFVRSFADDGADTGGYIDAPNLLAAAGLRAEDVTPELLAAAGLRPEDVPAEYLKKGPARPPSATIAPTEVTFDPTMWSHPAGLLYVFDDRPATGFYELVRELRDRQGRGSGLLVALLQSLGPERRKIVAVLGRDDAIRSFDRSFQADVGTRVDSGAIDWLKLRPDLQLQKESYDERFVVQDSSEYRAVREGMRHAEYMVLAASGG